MKNINKIFNLICLSFFVFVLLVVPFLAIRANATGTISGTTTVPYLPIDEPANGYSPTLYEQAGSGNQTNGNSSTSNNSSTPSSSTSGSSAGSSSTVPNQNSPTSVSTGTSVGNNGNPSSSSSGSTTPSCGSDTTICNPISNANNIQDLVLIIVKYLMGFIGLVSVVMVMWGGYQMVFSNGSDTEFKKGKQTLVNAVIGLAVVVLAYSIVAIIENVIKGQL